MIPATTILVTRLTTLTGTSPFEPLNEARGIPDASGSDASFAFIERQLAKCTRMHGACLQNEPSALPFRVLDIQDGPRNIKLSDANSGYGRYAVLSYCWGQQDRTQSLMLRRSSISQMRQHIPWDSIPPAFQDAILVAYRFQVNYLWIDSLCILQDSHEDWEREAGKMADYYQNAYVTIAASFVSSPTQSFLAQKDSRWLPKRFEFGKSQCPRRYMHARRVSPNLVPSNNIVNRTGWIPLARRGWAWQENVLSR